MSFRSEFCFCIPLYRSIIYTQMNRVPHIAVSVPLRFELEGSIIYTQMNRVPHVAVNVPLRLELEGTSEECSTKVHKYICSLIAILGGFLQLKQGARNESMFNIDYPSMVSLVIVLIAYIGSLIGSRILHVRARPHLDLAESFINKISLLLGTLALILEVVILVPGLGLVVGFFWVVWFVKVVVEYAWEYLKALYEKVVASVVHTFGKLKEYLNMTIRHFATEPKEQTDELPQISGFLQLKQGARNESLFNTNYLPMVSLIVALIAYIRSLIGSRILHVQARRNSDLAESFINKISLLLGTLSLILEVVILVPSLGLVVGFFWVVWFVKVVVEYACEFLKMLYKNAVASIIHTFSKLKDYLNMIIQRFATEPKEQNDELPQPRTFYKCTAYVYMFPHHHARRFPPTKAGSQK
ncbi:hypothetical protein DVH24_037050 [Malus domestica]|uniref:Uncharacterized protein n=1 Tax=Malus domestica TaxID=3750 RepID=A0A498HCS9_MALDO|nr:hypothetical protein DVH24_037050 [Malus domestica]